MIEDYYVWVQWFEGWQWWNFAMVIGGWFLAIWASAPLWKPLFVGKEIQDIPAAETPEDESEMSEDMKPFIENLKDVGGFILFIACVIYLLTFAAVIIAQIVRFAIRVTA